MWCVLCARQPMRYQMPLVFFATNLNLTCIEQTTSNNLRNMLQIWLQFILCKPKTITISLSYGRDKTDNGSRWVHNNTLHLVLATKLNIPCHDTVIGRAQVHFIYSSNNRCHNNSLGREPHATNRVCGSERKVELKPLKQQKTKRKRMLNLRSIEASIL